MNFAGAFGIDAGSHRRARAGAGWLVGRASGTYESVEHELRLTATHDGHVRMAVQLHQASLPKDGRPLLSSGWIPGEEMTWAAEDVAALVSPPESLRPRRDRG